MCALHEFVHVFISVHSVARMFCCVFQACTLTINVVHVHSWTAFYRQKESHAPRLCVEVGIGFLVFAAESSCFRKPGEWDPEGPAPAAHESEGAQLQAVEQAAAGAGSQKIMNPMCDGTH